ncbi:MAG: M4 family metallopeptidase [Edaphocola sp.]
MVFPIFAKANAQDSSPLNFKERYFKEGTYEFDDTLKFMRQEIFTLYKQQFGLGSNDEMILSHIINADSTGLNIVGEGHYYCKYEQFHKGYKVEGCHMNVLGQYDVVLRASGFVKTDLDVDVSNPISEATALNVALDDIGAAAYVWQDSTAEAELKETTEDSLATRYPTGSLTIRRIAGDTTAEGYRLCWLFSIDAIDPVGSYVIVVDAITGEIIDKPASDMGAQWSWGSVETYYNGVQPIQTATCVLCTRYTLYGPPDRRYSGWWWKWKNSTGSNGSVEEGKDNNNYWSTTETDTRTAATAYWIADKTRDYYVSKHGRLGSNYNGKKITVVANVPLNNDANAGYKPDIDNEDVVWIRPDNNNPAASLDIIGHELTHGFIKFHSNVGYYGDFDARSILEGFCDIFGQMIERSVTGTMDWVFNNDVGNYLRYFQDPHQDVPNASPSKYLEQGYWYAISTGGVGWYRNSGILRKWFYQLSTRTSYPAGIGIDQAEMVSYFTVNWWIWNNLQWPELANQSRAEAKYDFGMCSNTYKAVVQSWKDVNLLTNVSRLECVQLVPLYGNDAVIKHQGFRLRPSVEDNSDLPLGGTFSYEIPENWVAYQEGNDLVVTELNDNLSHKVTVVYTTPDSQIFYGNKIVHVVDSGSVTLSKKIPSKKSMGDEKENNIQIFPNPTSNILYLTFPQVLSNATYILSDIQGRQIITGMISGTSGKIEIPKLASGLYVLHVKANNFNVNSKIQIVQNH